MFPVRPPDPKAPHVQVQQPPRQRRNHHLPSRRVELHQSNWRRSARPTSTAPVGPPRLTMRPDQSIGVLEGCNRSDCRDTDHRSRSRPPDDPTGRCHRAPPIARVLVSAISLSCPIGRPWSSDTHIQLSDLRLSVSGYGPGEQRRRSQLWGSSPSRTHAYVHADSPCTWSNRHSRPIAAALAGVHALAEW